MSSPSSSSLPLRRSTHTHVSITCRRRFVLERIEPAIRGKSCPICLGHIDYRRAAVIAACLHAYCIDCLRRWSDLKRKCPLCNAEFDAWFFKINLLSRTFFKQQLRPLTEDRKVSVEVLGSRRRNPSAEQRVLRRSREKFSCVNLRTRPLPRQRWFGRSGLESSDAVGQRVIQWRASIYNQRLQAIPCSSRSCLVQNAAGNNGVKERILKRIEPWIHRELQAILGDPDPSVIVHVASSLFISSLDEKRKVPTERSVVEDSYLEPLRPFLHERSNMFWHELRCFAESPFNMETYDSVVEYTKL